MTRRLRILIVGDYPPDPRLGSAKVAYKLAEEFRAAGHHCDLLLADAIGARPSSRQVRQFVAPLMAAGAIRRAVSKQPYDVIDVSSGEGLWIGIARRLGGFRSTALICRSHGLEHLNYARMIEDSRAGLVSKPWSRRLWYPISRLTQVRAAARLADRLLVLNQADRQYAEAHHWQPPSRIDVVPHGVSERFIGRNAADEPRGGGALFSGSWDHMKGTAYLVEAFSLLAAEGRPVPLTIMGAGVPRAVVLGSFPEAVRRHVTVLDQMPEEAVMHEYRRHDVLVFTSTYEGFGLVVVEAMSQGLPVVATPVGCAYDLVRDGETGVRVACRDGAALAAAVSRLMSSPAERARLGQNAARAVSTMTWTRTAQRTLEVYERALAQIGVHPEEAPERV